MLLDTVSNLGEDKENLRIKSILSDRHVRDELTKMALGGNLRRAHDFSLDKGMLASLIEKQDIDGFGKRPISEAIVLLNARPALLVRNDLIEIPAMEQWRTKLARRLPVLNRAVKSVGRIELSNHPNFDWVGTGWMVSDDIIVTNRHVALEFAKKRGNAYIFADNFDGKTIEARVDFKEEYKTKAVAETAIEKIIFVAEDNDKSPDIALLRIKRAGNTPPPMSLAAKNPSSGSDIAVIGYPARDGRNDFAAMTQVFGDIYNVKRFSPGQITGANGKNWYFEHDCSTLGGNSGSAIIDVETGHVVGLHFGGRYRSSNYAVNVSALKNIMTKNMVKVRVGEKLAAPESIEEGRDKKTSPSTLADRRGYDEKFIGAGVVVPLPKFDVRSAVKLLKTNGGNGNNPHILKYEHFSVVMNQKRRLPMLTAVNIDGNQRRRITRKGTNWSFDMRIPQDAQIGGEFYGPTVFDRGHMVRREDPVWGLNHEAQNANQDSFHYTNACPQHPDLNQKTWLELENYILETTDAKDLKVCVFTGPVLSDKDPVMENVMVPLTFWKVVVVFDTDTESLAATGFMQSQRELVEALEFRFGGCRVYQTPVARIGELTGLEFSRRILEGDAMSADYEKEAPFSEMAREIRGSWDILLPRHVPTTAARR